MANCRVFERIVDVKSVDPRAMGVKRIVIEWAQRIY
jgi:hypothetical protein